MKTGKCTLFAMKKEGIRKDFATAMNSFVKNNFIAAFVGAKFCVHIQNGAKGIKNEKKLLINCAGCNRIKVRKRLSKRKTEA